MSLSVMGWHNCSHGGSEVPDSTGLAPWPMLREKWTQRGQVTPARVTHTAWALSHMPTRAFSLATPPDLEGLFNLM